AVKVEDGHAATITVLGVCKRTPVAQLYDVLFDVLVSVHCIECRSRVTPHFHVSSRIRDEHASVTRIVRPIAPSRWLGSLANTSAAHRWICKPRARSHYSLLAMRAVRCARRASVIDNPHVAAREEQTFRQLREKL